MTPAVNQREGKRGFITAPTLDDLKPTPQERYLLEMLWQWQEQSSKSPYRLGEPIKP